MSAATRLVRTTAVELFGPKIGCTDGGCIYGHPGGMHTNGGCNCLKERDLIEIRRHAQRLSLVARKLAESAPGGDV